MSILSELHDRTQDYAWDFIKAGQVGYLPVRVHIALNEQQWQTFTQELLNQNPRNVRWDKHHPSVDISVLGKVDRNLDCYEVATLTVSLRVV